MRTIITTVIVAALTMIAVLVFVPRTRTAEIVGTCWDGSAYLVAPNGKPYLCVEIGEKLTARHWEQALGRALTDYEAGQPGHVADPRRWVVQPGNE